MTTTTVWKPRASQIGGYLQCLWRAAQDRAIAEGRTTKQDTGGRWEETGFAPHGTCIHWFTQTGIGCRFPNWTNPTDDDVKNASEHYGGDLDATRRAFAAGDPRAWAPLKSEWELARTLFDGDAEVHNQVVASVSQVLASDLSKPANGRPWIAESAWETDYCTGHIDLLSDDFLELGDIKTTAKPPNYAKVSCKPGYLAQIVLYAHMVEQLTGVQPRSGFIHYIDSMHGNWTYRVPVRFTSSALEFYADQLEAFCRFLMSDQLWDVAYPNVGDGCEELWCPYRDPCKRAIMPPPGRWYDRNRAGRQVGLSRPKLRIGGLG